MTVAPPTAGPRTAARRFNDDGVGEGEPDQLGVTAASAGEGQNIDEQWFAGPPPWVSQVTARLSILPAVPSRTRARVVGQNAIDWRRSARWWARTGRISTQYVAQPAYRKSGPLVVLWDVSGSMAAYGDLYLPWLYGLVQASRTVGVFPFGTRVEEITELLRRPFSVARQHLSQLERLWVGGTQIGSVLTQWMNRYGARWLRGQPTVLLISDGWDVGHPDDLVSALRALRTHDASVYWMNPLADTPGYEPKTRALRAAKPYLDGFLSGSSVPALLRLHVR